MSSITLHNLDPLLDRTLRAKAEEDHTSLNQIIQKILKEALGLEKRRTQRNDFSDLCGTWTFEEALEFEEATKDLSVIDDEMWT